MVKVPLVSARPAPQRLMSAHGRWGSISCPGPGAAPTVSTQTSPLFLSPGPVLLGAGRLPLPAPPLPPLGSIPPAGLAAAGALTGALLTVLLELVAAAVPLLRASACLSLPTPLVAPLALALLLAPATALPALLLAPATALPLPPALDVAGAELAFDAPAGWASLTPPLAALT